MVANTEPVISPEASSATGYQAEPEPWRCYCVGDFRGFGTVLGRNVRRLLPTSYLVQVDGGATLTVPAVHVRYAENIRQFPV